MGYDEIDHGWREAQRHQAQHDAVRRFETRYDQDSKLGRHLVHLLVLLALQILFIIFVLPNIPSGWLPIMPDSPRTPRGIFR